MYQRYGGQPRREIDDPKPESGRRPDGHQEKQRDRDNQQRTPDHDEHGVRTGAITICRIGRPEK
jgi:hypothetical protein